MGDLKVKDNSKGIKILNRAENLGFHMRNSAIKVKNFVEEIDSQASQIQSSDNHNPSEYASSHIGDSAKYLSENVIHIARDNQLRKSSDRIINNMNDVRGHISNIQNTSKNSSNNRVMVNRYIARNNRRDIQSGSRAVRDTTETARKTIKTSKQTAKATIKTTENVVKTTQKTAEATAKTAKATAQATAQATKGTVRTAIAITKAAIKIAISTVKAIIAGLKSLVSAIVTGGWVAVIIIVAICLIGLVLGSSFGIFFSSEDSGTGLTMPSVISDLTGEFYKKVEDIKKRNPHDIAITEPMMINWIDILAIYAVGVPNDLSNPMDVATLDNRKVNKLRDILDDSVKLSYALSEEIKEQIVVDEDGNEAVEEVTIIILRISMKQKILDQMIKEYRFNTKQKAQLDEFRSPEYKDLWVHLIGSFYLSSNEILIGNLNFIPNNIYSWPLEGEHPITSYFGYRKDPFTGEIAYHEAIDIGTPQGTPILAAADGVVTIANSTDLWGGGWGLYVKIQHDSSYSTLYAHCSAIAVTNGQEVKKGQVIGYVGSTGNSTGYHLHWECYVNGSRVDPLSFFM